MQCAPPNRLGGVVVRSAAPEAAVAALGLELVEVTTYCGAIQALDRVSLEVRPEMQRRQLRNLKRRSEASAP
jgi:hypothetical protein